MYCSLKSKIKKFFKNKIAKNLFLIIIVFLLLVVLFRLDKLNLSDGWKFTIKIAQDICSFSIVITLVKDLFSLISGWFTEESKKISSNHHKIISQYSNKNLGHEIYKHDKNGNYFSKEGSIMQLKNLDHRFENRLRPSNKTKYSKGQNDEIKEISNFLKTNDNPVLNLPTLNLFTNNTGNVEIEISDSEKMYELNDLIINNVGEILNAHKHSKTSNTETIRLNDLNFVNGKLCFDMQRTSYYQMLLTNRAMDYEFQGMTLRGLYECKKKITPLKESCFGNQLGINGVIITSDGYLLIEHRSRRKTTWKNKYGQPISLSMKVDDFFDSKNEIKTLNDANFKQKFVNCILKTIKKNFNLTKHDCKEISFDNNFMGIARDLLEGGKPNIYFFVELNLTAKEATNIIQERAAITEELTITFDDETKENIQPLEIDKIKGKWFFVKYNDMKFNYQYRMVINKRKQVVYKIKMKRYPRYKWIFTNRNKTVYELNKNNNVDENKSFSEFKTKYIRNKRVSKKKTRLSKYTGEALLVCMSYLEILKTRISSLNSVKEDK